ncbi:MAG: CARDB domain-containing protein, partial [Waterburya sp.]
QGLGKDISDVNIARPSERADLVGTSVDVAQNQIAPGQKLDLDFTIANQGLADSENFAVDIYLSADENISATEDVKLGTYDIRNILEAGGNTGLKRYSYQTPGLDNAIWNQGDGKYYVGLNIDPKNKIAESNENNNSNQGLGKDISDVNVVKPTSTDKADLVGTSVDVAQNQIAPGQKLDLGFTIANQGLVNSENFAVDIYLSADENISATEDVKLGTYDINSIIEVGGDTGLKSYSYQTPGLDNAIWGKGDGQYYIGLDIDAQKQVAESNENNNSNQGLGKDISDCNVIRPVRKADLTVTSFKAPENFKPGDTITVEYELLNRGGTKADLFAAGFYLFTKDYLANHENLSIKDVPEVYFLTGDRNSSLITLNPGESTGKMTTQLTIPEDWGGFTGAGDYYLGVEADPYDDIVEGTEANNSLTRELKDYQKVTLDLPVEKIADVVVTNFKAPENFNPGDTITVEYELSNQGNGQADLFAAGFYLFTKDYLANNDNLSIEDVPEVYFLQGDRDSSLITLNPGESTGTMTTQLTIPEDWAGFSGTGDYYLGVQADPYDDVVESSEINNSLTGEMKDYQKVTLDIPVENKVDLVGTYFDIVQDQINPGKEFDLAFTIANQGKTSSENFEFELYLSADANISADEDYYLGSYRIEDGIAAQSDSGLKSLRYQAPAADHPFWSKDDGMYYAGMIIDPKNDIVETNETNNSNQGLGLDTVETNVIGLDAIADLKTSGKFNVKANTLKTGATCEVEYQISNDGTAPADLFAAGFYIFTEDYLTNNEHLSIEDVPEVYFLTGDRASSLISLEPGANTGVMTTELTIPTDWEGFTGSGEYYIGVAADPYGDIVESDELNNSLNGSLIDYEKVTINVI